MRHVTLFLALNILFCYGLLGSGGFGVIAASQKAMTCHARSSNAPAEGTQSPEGDSQNGGACVCHDSLACAPQNLELRLKDVLSASIAITPANLEACPARGRAPLFKKDSGYSPPEAFLANSAFLC
ncbi:MAG: hypothetical protein ACT4NX_03240 [Deltaproteobacteria bacterium]